MDGIILEEYVYEDEEKIEEAIKYINYDRIKIGPSAVNRKTFPWSLLIQILSGRPHESLKTERSARNCVDKGEKKSLFNKAQVQYRMIKRVAEGNGAGSLSRRMRACESEMRIKISRSISEVFLLFWYRTINGYGIKPIRPALIILTIVMVYATLYGNLCNGYLIDVNYYLAKSYNEKGAFVFVDKKPEFAQAIWHSIEISTIFSEPRILLTNGYIWWIIELSQRIIITITIGLFVQACSHRVRD